MCQTEIWKDIPHFPGYQASTEGRIRSVDRIMQRRRDESPFLRRGKVLRPIDNGNGYKAVNLTKDTDNRHRRYYIHRLVLETFTSGHDEYQTDVNHIDGDKSNNRLDNLEWSTMSENMTHAYNTGLCARGENHPQAKYSTELISTIRARRANGERVCNLSKEYGIPHQYISGILNGRKRING